MMIVGHRGARLEAPENTLEAFEHAQAKGCIAFELDVQLSADQTLMVFHDSSLKRVTGKRGLLVHQNAAWLKLLDARRNTPGWPTRCTIPTLRDVLNCGSHVIDWQLEVKPTSRHRLRILAQKLDSLLNELRPDARITITSSSKWFLKHMQANYPHYRCGYVAEWGWLEPVKVAVQLECALLALNDSLVNEDRLALAKQHKLEVSVWTVNELDRTKTLQQMGVDSIITDKPTIANQYFG
jgi:glycerophosphoryl diester phosphodiesterase